MTEKKMTPDQAKRRAQYARLVASLAAPQRTTLLHLPKQKQQPAVGAMRTA
jgi:hypothetical protein